jgi:hypothetical protein
VGVAKERKLPQLAAKSYRQSRRNPTKRPMCPAWCHRSRWPQATGGALGRHLEQLLPSANPGRRRAVLTQAGFRVQTTKGHICCGRRFTTSAAGTRAYLAKVLDRVAPEIEAGLPFHFPGAELRQRLQGRSSGLFPNDRANWRKKMSGRSGCWPTGWRRRLPIGLLVVLRARRCCCTAIATTRLCLADRPARSRCCARPARGGDDQHHLLRHGGAVRL